jgi:DNA-binding transcriptional LysR family regulator
MINLKTITQLDLNLLKVLEALYQHENMTRAAEQLNITPSAVSHSIKRLREALDDPLFTRQGTKMQPTPVCRRVMPDIIQTLSQLRRSLQSLGSFDPQTASQTLKLAIHDALEPLFFPAILEAFQQSAPKLNFHSVKLERESLPMQLESGQIDFAIDIARPLSSPIEHHKITTSTFCCLGGKRFFLEQQIDTKAYGQLNHVTVSNRPTGKVLEDLAFAKLGFNRAIKARCQSYPTAVKLLKQQKTILTLPHSIATSLIDSELKIMALPFAVPSVATHLYWHSQTQSDSLHSWLRTELLASLRNIS